MVSMESAMEGGVAVRSGKARLDVATLEAARLCNGFKRVANYGVYRMFVTSKPLFAVIYNVDLA